MTEKDTETKLIEPLLTILKWELMSMDIKKGYPIKTEENTKEADYVLMIDSKPRMIIEGTKRND